MTYYLLFILDHRNDVRQNMMLDKNQIQIIFLFEFKMGRKTAKRTCSTNNAFGPGTGKECTVQWLFKKFCKRDKSSLLFDEQNGQPLEVDKDQLRRSSKLILLKLHEKLLKNSTSTILWLFGI